MNNTSAALRRHFKVNRILILNRSQLSTSSRCPTRPKISPNTLAERIHPGRTFSTSLRACAWESTLNTQPTQPPTPAQAEASSYEGPLAITFRRLKIFSLSSLAISTTLAPFMFIVESNLPIAARLVLVGIAVGTSGVSTGLVGWCGKPYVTTLKRLKPEENDGVGGLEMTTVNIFLKPRLTRVYDPDFLVETKRPFAKWELADKIILPASRQPEPGAEETIAETITADNKVIGRWVVKWEENGRGTCHAVGVINRYFNVHEELLA